MSPQPITEADLHAYVDGALTEERGAAIEAYLVSRPDDAQRLRDFHEQRQALKACFDPIVDEPVPARLRAAAYRPPTNGTGWSNALPRWSMARAAAGIMLALVGGVLGWTAHDRWQPATLIAGGPRIATPALMQSASLPHAAAIAHAVFSPDVKRPVEIGADQEDQLVAWLSKRLGSPVRPPKLGALGFELIGGRLLPGEYGAVAQFMYHDSTGQRLTLYVSTENASNRDTAFRFAQEGPVNVFYWIDGKFGYALSAGIGKDDLANLATAVYDQLQPK